MRNVLSRSARRLWMSRLKWRANVLFSLIGVSMRSLRLIALAVAVLPAVLGCATFSEQIDIKRSEAFTGNYTVLSPRQKFRQLDEFRWFEIETGPNRCWGKIRFVDKARGFEGYAGFFDIPEEWVIESDDEEIVIAGGGYSSKLIFSTDGGRTFRSDGRAFPCTVAFVSVRKGLTRVGLFAEPDREGLGKGYLEWGRLAYAVKTSERDEAIRYFRKYDYSVNGRHAVDYRGRRPGDPEREHDRRLDSDFDAKTLVVLEAPISKLTGDIGAYRVLRPKGFRFNGFRYFGVDVGAVPDASIDRYVRDVDSLDSIDLPRATDPEAGSCNDVGYVPENAFGKNPEGFFRWFWATKKMHPDWPSPEQEAKIQNLYDKWISGESKTDKYWHLRWGRL